MCKSVLMKLFVPRAEHLVDDMMRMSEEWLQIDNEKENAFF